MVAPVQRAGRGAGDTFGWLLLDADGDGMLSAGDLVVRVDLPEGGAVTTASFVPATFALFGGGGPDGLTGTAGEDSLLGFGAADTLDGAAGNDTLEGGDGHDLLLGGDGFDTLRGAAGDDTLAGGAETDVLAGGAGNDWLDGGDAADLLLGGEGHDLLLAGAGDDTLEGGAGADTVFGDAGADRIILQAAGQLAWSSLDALDFVADFDRAAGDRLALGDPFGGLADGRFATAGLFTGADGIARPLVFNGSLAPRAAIAAGMALPPRPLGGIDTIQVSWIPALEGAAPAGGWLVLDLDRDGRLGAADFVARIGSADAPVGIAAADFAPGTFLSFGGGFVRAGTAGDDSLAGGSLGETFLGSAGSDRIAGGLGAPNGVSYAGLVGPIAAVVNGAATWSVTKPDGTDTLADIHAIAGTAGADTLDGSGAGPGFFASSLEGRAGADTLIGNSTTGVQASYGGSPAAVVVDLTLGTAEDGWGATDTLLDIRRVAVTSAFADTVLGSFADDVFLSGSAGNKTFDGRGGLDEYRYVGPGQVTIVLASTRFGDIVQGAYALKPNGTDRLAGIEIVVGGGGNDSLRGSAAEERLAGGMGQDTLDGGNGFDTVWYDTLSAGAALPSQGVVLNLTTGTATDPWGGTDTLSNIESAWGTQLGDDLTGLAVTGQRTWLRGLAGDDTLRAPVADSAVTADHATDPAGIVANLATGVVEDGWGGTDTLVLINHLRGSGFADRITGNALGNTLEGGAGDDTLNGGVGIDRLTGGAGDDTYIVDTQADLIFELANEGHDTLVTSASSYLHANLEDLTLAAGAGNIFGVGNALPNRMLGNEGNNLLLGYDGDDTIAGGAGNDTLNGVNGDDTLVGGLGNDWLLGGEGQDTLEAGEGNDVLYGQAGLDVLLGGDGIDYLYSGAGDDTADGGDRPDAVYGEDGNDLLYGGTGFFTDLLVGGNGNDTLDGSGPPGTALRNRGEYDRMGGGPGDDTYHVDTPFDLTFEGLAGGIDVVYADISGAGYYLYPHVDNLTLLGVTPFGVGNPLDNILTGNAVRNTLLGGRGNDMLDGMAGNDVLFGQSGADTFVFGRDTGADTIGDFTPGTDLIRLVGLGFEDASAVLAATIQRGPSCAIDFGAGDRVILVNVQKATLGAGDFLFG